MLRRMLSILVAPLAVALVASHAQAQAWPQRTVKLLVPFAAGGNIDAMGRIAAQRLSDALGQQFVVENRVGGNGTIATDVVKRTGADGYTLLWASTSVMSIVPAISKVNYDPLKDFTAVSLFQIAPQVLVVTNRMPANNVKEFGDNWRAMFPIEELCDEVVDSSHVGMRKPDREIYELTCTRMQIAPTDAVFLDDNADNVAAARAYGMEAVHFLDPVSALDELESILTRRGTATG